MGLFFLNSYAYATGTTDPNFGSVVLLLHGNGASGDTTFIDSSSKEHSVLRGGTVQLDSSQSPPITGGGIGSTPDASILFPAADGNYIYVDDPGTDFIFGTGDFTVEGWLRLKSHDYVFKIYDGRPITTEGLYPTIGVSAANKLIYYTNSAIRITGDASLAINTWYHWAYSRTAGAGRLFLNGVQQGSTYTDNNDYVNAPTRPRMGSRGIGNTLEGIDGWLDEIRVTKGVQRYTADFAPPTTQFPDA